MRVGPSEMATESVVPAFDVVVSPSIETEDRDQLDARKPVIAPVVGETIEIVADYWRTICDNLEEKL
jgi:hypothetical protein